MVKPRQIAEYEDSVDDSNDSQKIIKLIFNKSYFQIICNLQYNTTRICVMCNGQAL